MILSGLPPVAGENPTVLILGSMPGQHSLAAGEYYAHPRNAFWPLCVALGWIPGIGPYEARIRGLTRAGIALWDVLEHCERTGSLDSSILRQSERPNAVVSFLHQHPTITHVFFNGTEAENAFRRHVQGQLLPDPVRGIRTARLPSTSPTYTLSFERKLDAWRTVATVLAVGEPDRHLEPASLRGRGSRSTIDA